MYQSSILWQSTIQHNRKDEPMEPSTHTFNLTVEGVVDDAHLDAIVDLINSEAYVSNIRKVGGI